MFTNSVCRAGWVCCVKIWGWKLTCIFIYRVEDTEVNVCRLAAVSDRKYIITFIFQQTRQCFDAE